MAAKEKNENKTKKNLPSGRRKQQIIGILIIVSSFLILLSIFSYTPKDEANADVKFGDLIKVIFSPDPKLQAKADTTSNWLGIFGAIISNFLITSTIGYFAIIFPLLTGAWGWFIFKKMDAKKLLYITNISLLYGILLSTFIGLIKIIPIFSFFKTSWCGAIGAFLANGLSRTVGIAGGIIIMLTLLLVMLIITIDLDITTTFKRIKELSQRIIGWLKKPEQKDQPPIEEQQQIPGEDKTEQMNYHDYKETEEVSEPITSVATNKATLTREQLPLIEETKQKKSLTPKPNEQEEEIIEEQGEEIEDILNKDEVASQETEEAYDENIEYIFPSIDLLDSHIQQSTVSDYEVNQNKQNLIAKLEQFGIEIKDEDISVQIGPVFSLYEVTPPQNIKISQIVSLEDDIQLALQAKRIRIIAPMPGKGTVGIEISNRNPSNVYFREVISSKQFKEAKFTLPIAMGRTTVAMEKTTTGEIFCADLASIPHLLIAGATGSGKSIGINTIIASILYKMPPTDLKFIFIDPKKVELALYSKLKHHFLAKCLDILDEDIITTPQNSITILKSIVKEMEIRYDKLSKKGVRNIKDYNEKIRKGEIRNDDGSKPKKIPYIVVIIDELADLMITAAKEVEEPIARIAQLARAVGIHLVIATQRPSVDVITGTIKANFPARIAYQVASTTDSRTILNMNGAEDLIGKGDMLFLSSMSPKPVRIQNAYISTEEVEKIVDFIGKQKGGRTGPFELPSLQDKKGSAGIGQNGSGDYDELFEEAAKLIVRHQQGSVSLIQRRLKVGYSRAARIVDELEMAGIVGPFDGSKARAVLIETEEELEEILNNL